MTYLIPETCSKPCQVSKIMRHIENLRIARNVYSNFLHMETFHIHRDFSHVTKSSIFKNLNLRRKGQLEIHSNFAGIKFKSPTLIDQKSL